jgi:hypothetical protein
MHENAASFTIIYISLVLQGRGNSVLGLQSGPHKEGAASMGDQVSTQL